MARQSQAVRDAARERVLDAAQRVLQTSGPGGLNMRAVAREAGCTAGALYTYVPNKSALVRELALKSLEDLGDEVVREVAKDGNDNAVRAAARAVRGIYGPKRPAAPLLAVLLHPADGGSPDAAFERRVTGMLIGALAPLAGALCEAGRAPAQAEREALAAASFLFGLALLESSGWLGRLFVNAEEVVEAFAVR